MSTIYDSFDPRIPSLALHYNLSNIEKEIQTFYSSKGDLDALLTREERITHLASVSISSLILTPVMTLFFFEVSLISLSLIILSTAVNLIFLNKLQDNWNRLELKKTTLEGIERTQGIAYKFLAVILSYHSKKDPSETLPLLNELFEESTLKEIEQWLKDPFLRFSAEKQLYIKESLYALRSKVFLSLADQASSRGDWDDCRRCLQESENCLNFLRPETLRYDELKDCLAKLRADTALQRQPGSTSVSPLVRSVREAESWKSEIKTKALQSFRVPSRPRADFIFEQVSHYQEKLLAVSQKARNFSDHQVEFEREGIKCWQDQDPLRCYFEIPELPEITFSTHLFDDDESIKRDFQKNALKIKEARKICARNGLDKIFIPECQYISSLHGQTTSLFAFQKLNKDFFPNKPRELFDYFTEDPDLKQVFCKYLEQLVEASFKTKMSPSLFNLSLMDNGSGLAITNPCYLEFESAPTNTIALIAGYLDIGFFDTLKTTSIRNGLIVPEEFWRETYRHASTSQSARKKTAAFYKRKNIFTGKESVAFNYSLLALSEEEKKICEYFVNKANNHIRAPELQQSLTPILRSIRMEFSDLQETLGFPITSSKILSLVAKLIEKDQIRETTYYDLVCITLHV